MTNKPTDDEIIKALECCAIDYCNDCPLANEDIEEIGCDLNIHFVALDLIDRLKVENEEVRKDIVTAEEYAWKLKAKNEALQMDNEQLKSDIINERMNLEHIQAENERLKKENEGYAELEQGCLVSGYKNIRAEAIKEFAVRLKENMFGYYECIGESAKGRPYKGDTLMDYEVVDMIEDCVDNLVKEMVGENDENT